MRAIRKALALLLSAAMALTLAPAALAADETDSGLEGKIVILHTNDTHGRVAFDDEEGIVGFDGAAALRRRLESEGAEVLMFDAGDATQGAPVINNFQGLNAVEFMNAAGYDAATVGSHDFDYRFDNLLRMRNAAEYDILCANLTYRDTGDLVFDDNRIFDCGGVRIGVFGLCTPETMTTANPVNTANLSFGDSAAELYAVAAEQVVGLEAAGCDLIVCIGYLGTDESSSPYRSTDVIGSVAGIDLFIDGNSHTLMESGQVLGGTLLVSAGEYFSHVGCVVYDPAERTLEASVLTAADVGEPESSVTAIIEAYTGEVASEYSEVFAVVEYPLNGTREGGDDEINGLSFPEGEGSRACETNLGDLLADAVLWQARESVGSGVSAALINGGSIRASIPAGEITRNDIVAVSPYENSIAVVTVTGAQLLEALEAATWCSPAAVGSFPQVAGMEFTVDTRVDYAAGELYPDSTYHAPAEPGSRVTITSIGGEELDPEAEYMIATNDLIAAGGESYYAFTRASYKFDIGISLEDALANYISGPLGGTVGGQYASPQGRVRLIETALDEFTDLTPGAWYEQSVGYAVENGYMVGAGNGEFRPDDDMTRAQYMTALYRIGESRGAYPEAETTGEDWAAAGARLAADYGLDWTEEELSEPVTRYEIVFAANELRRDITDGAPLHCERPMAEFSDLAGSGERGELVSSLYAAGLINGYGDGTFRPDGTATRAEISQIIYNLLEVVCQDE